jgi:hypothetical protein
MAPSLQLLTESTKPIGNFLKELHLYCLSMSIPEEQPSKQTSVVSIEHTPTRQKQPRQPAVTILRNAGANGTYFLFRLIGLCRHSRKVKPISRRLS